MKIAIPVEEKKLNSNVCVSFGRAPYFLFYDVETKESVFVENKAAASTGGAGIKASQTIVDNKANVLITPLLGKNAADVLIASNIKIFKSSNSSVEENIKECVAGNLSELKEIHAGFHKRRGN